LGGKSSKEEKKQHGKTQTGDFSSPFESCWPSPVQHTKNHEAREAPAFAAESFARQPDAMD
jgi:hypothetical protein